ncbi:MAG TPA: ribonuclease III family protein [Candidatus Bathyarchaeia archaeon]
MNKSHKAVTFTKTYKDLNEILTDHELASLGDAYINFVYSLALSSKNGKPSGAKVKGTALAEALRKAELRHYLGTRVTSHMQADAAEALIVYAWLKNQVTLEESVVTLQRAKNTVEGLSQLLTLIKKRVKFV